MDETKKNEFPRVKLAGGLILAGAVIGFGMGVWDERKRYKVIQACIKNATQRIRAVDESNLTREHANAIFDEEMSFLEIVKRYPM